jgi:hypothetical protein
LRYAGVQRGSSSAELGLEEQAISQESVEAVRRFIEATNQRDFAAAMDAYADDVVLVVDEGIAPTNAGTFSGRKAVGNRFADPTRADQVRAPGSRPSSEAPQAMQRVMPSPPPLRDTGPAS